MISKFPIAHPGFAKTAIMSGEHNDKSVDSLNSVAVALACLLVFLVSPVFSVLICLCALTLFARYSWMFVSVLALVLALFLGLINVTKELTSDLQTYAYYFEFSSDISITEFLTLMGKEPIFFSVMHFFSAGLSSDFKLFVFALTATSYFFIFSAIQTYIRHNFADSRHAIVPIILTAFFFELFSLSGHLIRQFLAGALVFWGLLSIQKPSRKFFIMCIAGFIHSSALFFIVVPYLQLLLGDDGKGKTRRFRVVGISALTAAFIGTLSVASSEWSYVITRLTMKSDSFNSIHGLELQGILLLIASAFAASYMLCFVRNNSNQMLFSAVCLITAGFSLAIALVNELVAYRMAFYSYFFFPMLTSVVIATLPFIVWSTITRFLCLFLMLRFALKLEGGVFVFAKFEDILFSSVWTYFDPLGF